MNINTTIKELLALIEQCLILFLWTTSNLTYNLVGVAEKNIKN